MINIDKIFMRIISLNNVIESIGFDVHHTGMLQANAKKVA
jgi:methylmalonyl-CoA mutase cobalamin-binding subunit